MASLKSLAVSCERYNLSCMLSQGPCLQTLVCILLAPEQADSPRRMEGSQTYSGKGQKDGV